MEEKLALEAIRKKLLGKKLSYKEIYAVMDQIAEEKLGTILTTYFVASGYSNGFSNEELYFLTRAMVETGEFLEFKGIVADKHSIGGNPGTRTTMVIVPIIAAAGFLIPKSSSRAITTPAGTADAMETIAKVSFTKEQIYKIVEKTNGCIVWGGSFKIAPADDEIIKIEEPLLFESYDKVLVSIMAKKVAFGSNHVIIDIPYGKNMKVRRKEDADLWAEKFKNLAKKFDMKLKTLVHNVKQPSSRGVGPLLEAREALMVLEQRPDRSMDLENDALELCSELLDLCLKDASESFRQKIAETYIDTKDWARYMLTSGKAHEKMREIIKAQEGNPEITSEKMHPSSHQKDIVHISGKGEIKHINSKNLTLIARLLGAPEDKKAGIYLHKMIGDTVEKGEALFALYGKSAYALREARDSLDLFPIFEIGK